jgi:hypothetical protein
MHPPTDGPQERRRRLKTRQVPLAAQHLAPRIRLAPLPCGREAQVADDGDGTRGQRLQDLAETDPAPQVAASRAERGSFVRRERRDPPRSGQSAQLRWDLTRACYDSGPAEA